jgi:ABC-type amino acid transport substrate-binding protein
MQYYLQDTYGSNIHIKTYSSIQQAFLDLKNGRVDAVLSDQPVIYAWLAKDNNKQKFSYLGKGVVSKKYFSGGTGIAVAKSNTALLAKLNASIVALKKSGQLAKIIDKHMGSRS